MIHPTAIVDPRAELGRDVEIAAYAIVRAGVVLGDRTCVGEHAIVEGPSELGPDNVIHPHAVVGGAPQDLKYRGEPTRLVMGDNNIIREFATLNRGTEQGGGITRVGSRNMFMAYSHVAHDCHVGSNVVMANGATLAGHIEVGDFVIVGGLAAIHQFSRVGESAMLAGGAMVAKDVPPFAIVHGNRARLIGANSIGLKRRGFPPEEIEAVTRTIRSLIHSKTTFEKTLEEIESAHGGSEKVRQMLAFMRSENSRGVLFKDRD
jgi:UDP-N-acetylglucosamine acyltransferase